MYGLNHVRFTRPMTSALVPLLLGLQQIALPAPRGYINDFAGVLDSASIAHMQAVIADVREKTRGEIVLVTLPDIGDRQAADVALQIGRQWGVGAKGEAGDPAKNLGVVVLLEEVGQVARGRVVRGGGVQQTVLDQPGEERCSALRLGRIGQVTVAQL